MRLTLGSPRRTLAYLLVALGVCSTAFGQERFGEIMGAVKDPTNAGIPNATVNLTNLTTNRVLTVNTANDGLYAATNVEPGRYKVRVEASGFSVQEFPDVNVLVGKTVRLDVDMKVGQTSETVQVTDAAPLIDFTTTKVAANVTAEEFDRLPKPRTFTQLATLSTSVNSGQIEGGFQVNGASGAENAFVIDGVNTTSIINGNSRQTTVFEILQEVQVKTGGIDAEYGGATGGVITAITKSGGNAFHGDIHYYNNSNGINAGPVKRLLLSPTDEKTVSYQQDGKFKSQNQEIGGSLGGRLIRDKAFFFSAFSPRFQRESRPYTTADAQTVNLTRDTDAWQMFHKLTLNPTNKLRANLSWLWSPTRVTGSLPAYNNGINGTTTTAAGLAPNAALGTSTPQTSYTGQIDYTPDATSLISIRGGRYWDDYKSTGVSPVTSVTWGTSGVGAFQPNPAFPQYPGFTLPANLQQGSGYSNTPRVTNTAFDIATRTFLQLDGSKIVNAWGQHTFKAGWGFQKNVNKVQDAYPGGGYVQIFWNSTYTFAGQTSDRGPYGYYEVNQRGVVGTTGGRAQNVYFQDTWRIKNRLTLSLGLRLENEHVPSFRRDIRDDAFAFNFGDKIAPRLGASYDLLGNGKVKLYGSWNRLYNWVPYELSRGSFGADTWCIFYRSLDSIDATTLANLGTGKPGRDLWQGDGGCRNRRVPNFDSVDPKIKPFSTDLINGGVEFQIQPQSVLRVGYVHNNMRRAIEDLGVLVGGNEVYIYANPGEGQAVNVSSTTGLTPIFPYPKPQRTYDALELQFTRRFAKSYFFQASYVYSRLYGNYPGLGASDEISLPTSNTTSATAQQQSGSVARPGTSASRAWDLDEYLFDSHGNLNVTGRLATDRPSVVKLYGAKDFAWGKFGKTTVGANFYGASGTPMSTYVYTSNQVPVFVNGRGDMGRTPILTQTDLNVYHDYSVKEGKVIRVEMNMLNLFNQKTNRYDFPYYNRGAGLAQPSSAMNLSQVNLFNGYDYKALVAATPDAQSSRGALDNRYGMAALFNTGFQGRFGLKFIF